MKLLTFLGAGEAYETTYVLPDGRSHTAPYCGVALARFHPDSDMRVFVTGKARAKHLDAFTAQVEDHVASLLPVDIPDGRDEAEMWGIFQAVVAQVEPDDTVIFDITHGYRSLPFLSFLAAAYLRVARNMKLEAVYYGNFEARDQSSTPHRAPVIDLTRFVDLLDWTVAADRFVRQGDAQDLADRLRALRPDYQVQQRDPAAKQTSLLLSNAAGEMTRVSQALQLLRPAETMEAIAALPGKLDALREVTLLGTLPFGLISERVKTEYGPLALAAEAQQATPVEALRIERDMIQWHLGRGQYVQAVGLGREWLVTWMLLHAGFDDPLDGDTRNEVERTITTANKERQSQHGPFGDHTFSTGMKLRKIPQAATALDLYNTLGDLRNDIMHAGKRHNPTPAKELAEGVNKHCLRLFELPLPGEGNAG